MKPNRSRLLPPGRNNTITIMATLRDSVGTFEPPVWFCDEFVNTHALNKGIAEKAGWPSMTKLRLYSHSLMRSETQRRSSRGHLPGLLFFPNTFVFACQNSSGGCRHASHVQEFSLANPLLRYRADCKRALWASATDGVSACHRSTPCLDVCDVAPREWQFCMSFRRTSEPRRAG
jgi:hypothetical protein